MKVPSSNFAQLEAADTGLLRLGLLAERYFPDDPNTALLKLRQFAERLAQQVAARIGLYTSAEEPQYDLIRRLREHGILTPEVARLFGEVRRAGNAASHAMTGDHRGALAALKIAWQLGVWFQRTFKDPSYRPGPFIPPRAPAVEPGSGDELRAELERLAAELAHFRTLNRAVADQRDAAQAELRDAREEQVFWERLAAEAEGAKTALAGQLAALQAQAAAAPPATVAAYVTAANSAAEALELDETATRRLIDEQLREAGWTVDSAGLRHGQGARPQKGQNLAIAEWPTESGPADYALFYGLMPLATVEAKRRLTDIPGALQQAKRTSRGFKPSPETLLPPTNYGAAGEYRVPFAFSTNGRPYLRQIETRSGIWFCDLRRPDNLSRPLDGWYSPEGLAALLKQDTAAADAALRTEPFDCGLVLRHYQQAAILAVEAALAAGVRALLIAMATGTGKTKTCIALIYRLLKTGRFRRILFLVDRSALGEQAANAFKETRMEGLQTFADIYSVIDLDSAQAASDTAVHIATVQGMIQRILAPGPDAAPPPVDRYDCIVVDECHRGYLLDRDLSDTELGFRPFGDYISKYRRVLDWFDAVKIGLTATPALHTTQIFGPPIFTYGYREAVIDGYLVDHEPPVQIRTELSAQGIRWRVGEEVQVYDRHNQQLATYTTPDELHFEVDAFNRQVLTESFNRVVCDYLARELDPAARHKTLIFCATDAHADLVVHLLKDAFRQHYGSVTDDAVIKITGAADRPLQLIRRYKNERDPNVAVTVDLLTTGLDVPEICNLVFLRRVNSRILFDQMLGRATRPCDEIGKDCFRIFDAVRIYEALATITAMQPVVVDPAIGFTQLAAELVQVTDDAARALVRDQFVAKLQRKLRHLSEGTARDFEAATGETATAFIQRLRAMPLADLAGWFNARPGLGELLDRPGSGPADPLYISGHADRLLSAESGYGQAQRPEDYLAAFDAYVREHRNRIPALLAVLTRPRDLTRKDLRDLELELAGAGFTEVGLATAWREQTNQDIAARIVGFIRRAAIGDPLIPYAQRVDQALQRTLASRPWTAPQRQWLQRIAAQTKANLIVDRAAFDDRDLVFRREGGGFDRLDRLFGGELAAVLGRFNAAIWESDAA